MKFDWKNKKVFGITVRHVWNKVPLPGSPFDNPERKRNCIFKTDVGFLAWRKPPTNSSNLNIRANLRPFHWDFTYEICFKEKVFVAWRLDQGVFLSLNLGFMSPLFNSFLSFSNVCREGRSTRRDEEEEARSMEIAFRDEMQLRIDPIHGDVDAEVIGLHSQVRQLRNVSSSLILRNER